MRIGGIETMARDLMSAPGIGGVIVSLSGRLPEIEGDWPGLISPISRIVGFNQENISHARLQWLLVRFLRRIRPSCVILHHIGPLLHGGIAARLAGVDRVVHIEHDAWHYNENPKHRRLASFCELVVRPRRVAVSSEIAQAVSAFLPSTNFTVVPPGVDTDKFRPSDSSSARERLGLRKDWRIIGTVGRLVAIKGQKFLIEALLHLADDVHIVIVGSGEEAEALQSLAQQLRVNDRVHFLGTRWPPERVLPAFDLFCLPSLAEGLPRSILEAQSCGLRVVASDVGSIRAALAPSGALVVAGNAFALASKLNAMLSARPTPDETRKFVVDHFSLKATAAALHDLVTEGA
jgi:glycosyltransferase involved in cell wall biosynthesis